MSIYAYEVEEAITKLEKAGADVMNGDWVIYAGKGAEFNSDLYPLPIMVINDGSVPDGVAYIAKRDTKYEMQIPQIIELPQ